MHMYTHIKAYTTIQTCVYTDTIYKRTHKYMCVTYTQMHVCIHTGGYFQGEGDRPRDGACLPALGIIAVSESECNSECERESASE